MVNKKKSRKLKDIDVDELSLVDASANRKKFAMIKSAAGESLEELLHFLQDKGSEEVAMQKAESLGTEDIADYVEALSVLKKYDGYFPGEILDALAVLVGLCPQLQKAQVTPVAKFAGGGALDQLFHTLAMSSRNARMIGAMLKGANLEEDVEELEDDVAPGQRGISKSIKHQEEDVAPEVKEDYWPSL